MIALYPQIKSLHVHLIVLSGLVFALRGAFLLGGARWPRSQVVRWSSITIDTILLTSAAMLFTLLPRELFANGWLTTKLILLVVYVALGVLAFRPHPSRLRRAAFYLAALAVYVFMYGIARAHHPAGWLYRWLA